MHRTRRSRARLLRPRRVSYEELLRVFWEGHDPTQGMRQGGDVGTQYRSAIYYFDDEQRRAAEASRDAYQRELTQAGYGTITTEITPAPHLLLGRGLSPAVSRQESPWVLRARRHRGDVSDRSRAKFSAQRAKVTDAASPSNFEL